MEWSTPSHLDEDLARGGRLVLPGGGDLARLQLRARGGGMSAALNALLMPVIALLIGGKIVESPVRMSTSPRPPSST